MSAPLATMAEAAEGGQPAEATAGAPSTAATAGARARPVGDDDELTLAALPGLVVVHVAIPAALIGMLGALLFFLIDVRSVYLPQGERLKWIGACFVCATVLIVRYGRMYHDRARQGAYLLFLGLASLAAVTALSDTSGAGPAGALPRWLSPWLNGGIFAGVFALATALTQRLSLDDDGDAVLPGPVVPRVNLPVYMSGLPRLPDTEDEDEPPALPSADSTATSASPTTAATSAPAPAATSLPRDEPDPARGIALLSLLALPIFALGERPLLAGPPEVGPRALLAVIVYCFCAAVLLAAGSAAAELRWVRRRGGTAQAALLPVQVGVAAALAGLVLIAALATPGLRYQGTGAAQPAPQLRPDSGQRGGAQEQPRSDAEPDAEGRDPQQAQRSSQRSSVGGETPGALASLLKLSRPLIWLVGGVILLLAGAALWRARGPIAAWLGQLRGAGLRGLLARLWSRLRPGRRRTGRRSATGDDTDAWAGWGELARLDPTDAVRAAYGRMLAVAESLGCPRPRQRTPLEFVRLLPHPLRPVEAAVATLTDLYLQAAYTPGGVGPDARAEALRALAELQALRPGARPAA